MVEDDLDMHYLYRRVLSALGMEGRLVLFDRAEDALSFLQLNYHRTSIIFSDVNMPMVDGLELRKRINDNILFRRYNVPFLFLSTSADIEDVQRAEQLNIQGFLKKGETLDDIHRTLKSALDSWDKFSSRERALIQNSCS